MNWELSAHPEVELLPVWAASKAPAASERHESKEYLSVFLPRKLELPCNLTIGL